MSDTTTSTTTRPRTSAFATVDTRTSTAANAVQRGPSIAIASLRRTTDRARRPLLPCIQFLQVYSFHYSPAVLVARVPVPLSQFRMSQSRCPCSACPCSADKNTLIARHTKQNSHTNNNLPHLYTIKTVPVALSQFRMSQFRCLCSACPSPAVPVPHVPVPRVQVQQFAYYCNNKQTNNQPTKAST